jgi:hypothetical protein
LNQAKMTMTVAGALAGIAAVLVVAAIVALAVSAMEFPREMRTFTGASDAERQFDQRAKWWEWSGFTSLSIAAVISIIAALMAIR